MRRRIGGPVLAVLGFTALALGPVPSLAGGWDEYFIDAGGPYAVDADDEVLLTASGFAVGLCNRIEYAWDLTGDGLVDTATSTSPEVSFDGSDWDGPVELTVHVYIECWLADEVAAIEDSDDATVTVRNVAPTILTVDRDATPREGEAVALEVVYDDPEAGDTHTVTWTLGDGQVATGPAPEHTWVQDGEYELVVEVVDDDGGRDVWAGTVDVGNVPPSIVGSPLTSAVPGQPWSFSPSVEDPGADDVHSWSATLPDGATLDPETGEVRWIPGPDDLGAHAFTLSVEDDAGDGDTVLWTLTVAEEGTGTETETETSPGGRPIGDGSADADPWADAYPVEGEGCRCATGSGAAAGAWGLGLLAVARRRRR